MNRDNNLKKKRPAINPKVGADKNYKFTSRHKTRTANNISQRELHDVKIHRNILSYDMKQLERSTIQTLDQNL
jgi:hypothetical protein